MSAQRSKSGTHTAVTAVATLGDLPVPITLVLRSAAAGRSISLSFDGGVEYFTPALDQSSATQHVLHCTAPATHVRFTGAVNDTWLVIWNRTDG